MVWEEGKFQFLGIVDALSIISWLFIILSSINSQYQKKREVLHYRYYKNAFYAKFISALVFSVIYIRYYEGGDSTAYWDTAQKLNNLFWESPTRFLQELLSNDPLRVRYVNFDFQHTGMPPNWIYKEDEAWFAAKIYTLLTFITFKSYFAMTMITAYVSFRVSWLLYELVLKYKVMSDRTAAIGIHFLPSTCFWCTGITKDMLIYCAVIYLLIQLFTFLNPIQLRSFRNLYYLGCSFVIILNVRDFMLVTAVGPFFMALGARWSGKQNPQVFQNG
jgi:hypothetical protein